MTQIHNPNMKVGLLHMNATRPGVYEGGPMPPPSLKIPIGGLKGVCAPKYDNFTVAPCMTPIWKHEAQGSILTPKKNDLNSFEIILNSMHPLMCPPPNPQSQ